MLAAGLGFRPALVPRGAALSPGIRGAGCFLTPQPLPKICLRRRATAAPPPSALPDPDGSRFAADSARRRHESIKQENIRMMFAGGTLLVLACIQFCLGDEMAVMWIGIALLILFRPLWLPRT